MFSWSSTPPRWLWTAEQSPATRSPRTRRGDMPSALNSGKQSSLKSQRAGWCPDHLPRPPTWPGSWVLVSVSAGFVTSRGQASSRAPHVCDYHLCSFSLCVIVAIFPQWRNEAQRGEGLCPRSHSKHVEEQGCKAWFSRLPGGEAGDGCQGLSDQGASFLSLLLGEQIPVKGD